MEQEPSIGMTEALGSHGGFAPTPVTSGHHFDSLGRTWTVSTLEHGLKALFEQWVRRNAERAIQEQDNPEFANQMLSAYCEDRGAGKYNWGGSAIRRAMHDVHGLSYLLYLLLKNCHPEMTPEMAQKILRGNQTGTGLAIGWATGNSSTPDGAKPAGGNKKKRPATETFDED